ncbi:hypothetical protein ACVIRO_001059 [Rhizobium ruizarguesonis]
MTAQEELGSVHQLFFEAPLYKRFSLNKDLKLTSKIFGKAGKLRFDGHCPTCRQYSTWEVGAYMSVNTSVFNQDILDRTNLDWMSITCARDETHEIRIYLYYSKLSVEKIGQYPSLATIANDEASRYRSVMSNEDGQEFHKAIGLAAHGVGVGSFVYLRRVFERLVHGRFEEWKAREGWTDEQFLTLRMSDKVMFLRDHLPSFLVEHSRIYGILSAGIHELSEEKCLAFFEPLKHSIIIILEEDKKKKEELALRQKFSSALSKIELP